MVEVGSSSRLGHWLFLGPAVGKPLLPPSVCEVFGEDVTRLGIVVMAGINVVLDMSVNVIKVVVVDAEDVCGGYSRRKRRRSPRRRWR